jgi:hypothetical protein
MLTALFYGVADKPLAQTIVPIIFYDNSIKYGARDALEMRNSQLRLIDGNRCRI